MSMHTEMKLQLYAFRLHINVFKVKQQSETAKVQYTQNCIARSISM